MQYGLVGEKLGHSYSKEIHESLGFYQYELYPVSKEELVELLETRNFLGLNVTIPYKQTVMPYCDYLAPIAKQIGAVNTLYFNAQGKLCGTNTDYYGFCYAMKEAGIVVETKTVLILGDGATSKTVTWAVTQMGAAKIVIASRREQEFQENNPVIRVNYADLHRVDRIQVIINTTPVGMYPNVEQRPIDLTQFPDCEGVFDVIYNPEKTKLLAQAEELGIRCSGGIKMLTAQAEEAARYFTHRKE
ncbi:MAG: shikimate dehydrogenase [Lachnospiraceae bacterium]